MKKVNTGGLTFEEIRKSDKFYVDKTLLIKDVLDNDERGVYLFTRPRRFGKTTNITMLDAFFNIEYEGNDWFDGLAISDHPEYAGYKNAFPVICVDMKDVVPGPGSDYDGFIDNIQTLMCDTYLKFEYLLDSDRLGEKEKNRLEPIFDMTSNESLLASSLKNLCQALEKHHERKVIVLIDEYDRAITDSFGTPLQERVIGFLGSFLSSTLKSNSSLQMAYVTGVMQVARAGMFSGLNNMTVNNVFSTRSDERFGFTESEVREILGYYGHPERFDEVREWYDGYRFGNAEVYNPFSVMNYVAKDFTPAAYWVNTSADVPLKWLIQRVDADSLGTVANLINGHPVRQRLHFTMTYEEMNASSEKDLYSLMVMTGYMNAVPDGDDCIITIPNKEVRSIVDDMMSKNIRVSDSIFSDFNSAVLEGDAERMASILQTILCDASYFDLKDESSYELVLLTIMHGILRDYEVRSQKESGNGRADLILTPTREGIVPIIMELKVADSESVLDSEVDGALEQIRSRRYHLGMTGKVVLVGLAFFGKVPRCRTEVVSI